MLRLDVLVALLHAYIGGRLLPDLPYGLLAASALALMLLASALLVPLGFVRSMRRTAADRLTWAGLIALGLFSSLIALTFVRDIALVLAFAASGWFDPPSIDAFAAASAGAVPLLALAITLVGFLNARRRARVRDVRVPIRGLPEALHGFCIAQISDLHVGPTITTARPSSLPA